MICIPSEKLNGTSELTVRGAVLLYMYRDKNYNALLREMLFHALRYEYDFTRSEAEAATENS